ncbi:MULTISPECIES: alpha/beta fold hydrolase [Streptomyces]|uniref:Pimeloyl-ACP methyl ester carboxylesterase n=1 Tax=Streptomyces stelliscabiei TaxID=146820 RepID=A0A8I0TVK6_9ACTN|nr:MULTISPECIES: alpha/beta hydrolase [Streptomyces]KND40293.1 alpha/beta hydrolase [Streptomyces stelliscabiei]MBE1601131.1 pimeloyl-ACP methyl ester carboxylesterase [Streptomyces stelliscabiei]MDX2517099.1 alpha/beta hydrolase [Streptomyces stelliscabiei]MDX2554941.1 alpha/beta hydrolase [Streptomyces stelliscabiei]MDX2611168.1 alpha/beta hydrolase [Streptomyces stelliscabiei]
MVKTVKTPSGGRTIAYETWGDPDAHPVFLLHGTPGSRLGPRLRTFDLHKLGVRLIAYDRPGYGGSDRHGGRTVVDAAHDVSVIAEDLDLKKYSVVGRSGGAPHALACAARNIGSQVASVAALVSLAPPDADGDGFDWHSEMSESNVSTYDLLDRHAPDVTELGALLARNAETIRRDPTVFLASLREEMPSVDRVIVEDAGIREHLLRNYLSAVGRAEQGEEESVDPRAPMGWVDDLVAFRTHWGFKLQEIDGSVPVMLWHGERDVFAPVAHFHWLTKRIPSAKAVLQPSAAHFAALPALPQVLAWTRDAAGR